MLSWPARLLHLRPHLRMHGVLTLASPRTVKIALPRLQKMLDLMQSLNDNNLSSVAEVGATHTALSGAMNL